MLLLCEVLFELSAHHVVGHNLAECIHIGLH